MQTQNVPAKNFPLFKVHVEIDEALKQMRQVLESGFINEGTQVTELTHRMADILGSKKRLERDCGLSRRIRKSAAGRLPLGSAP